tara:strand:- start:98 stop:838 length:741 start_codon:yes stop_codon:yes gene_type:complete
MKRYLFEINFIGKNYHGWQIQKNADTVQETINKSITNMLQYNYKLDVVGCGRTDKGVHAEQFFFHVDLPDVKNINKLIYRLNNILPSDISVNKCIAVGNEFHARFSAVSRTYQYRIIQQKNPFLNDFSAHIGYDLDFEMMNICAKKIKKYRDFKSFTKVHNGVNNFICNITDASWFKDEHQLIFSIKANRFLRNMVRAIVGTIILVGRHKINIDQFCQIIESRDRSNAGPSVSAKGLFLTNVEYHL